jgi:hypothetical protein
MASHVREARVDRCGQVEVALELVCVLLAAEKMPRPAATHTLREFADLAARAEVIDVDDTHARIGAQGEVIVLGTQSAKFGVLGEPLAFRVVKSDEQGLGSSILGDPLALRLGEQPRQPRQPFSVVSCNLGNCVEDDGFHLVERDARRLIQACKVCI